MPIPQHVELERKVKDKLPTSFYLLFSCALVSSLGPMFIVASLTYLHEVSSYAMEP
jgi:hypothetical protein